MLNIRHIYKKNDKRFRRRSQLFSKRIAIPSIVILVIFVFYLVYSFNFQIINSDQYIIKASQLSIEESTIQPLRGIFYDVNGVPLVKNIERFDLYIKKKDYKEADINNIAKVLSKDLQEDINDILKDFTQLKNQNYDLKIKSNLDAAQAINIQSDLQNNSSIYFKSGFKRDYIYPKEFSHIIGYTGSPTEEDIKNGYSSDDQIGKYKLELQLQDQLKGIKGKSIYMGGIETKENSQPGDNVYLTINSQWQTQLYKILGSEIDANDAAGGAGVIVDDSNGNIVAMMSYPGIDTNLFINGISSEQYQSYLNDREKPLIDKAIGQAEAPGSSFKLITTYALLQNNIIDPNATFYSNRCIELGGGARFCEYHELLYGSMNLERALYKSSNLYFCNSMLKMQAKDEYSKFVDAASLFNIGQKTGINLIGETNGNMDSPEYRKETTGANWYSGDTCNAAIGQGAVLVTPLQMAMVASVYENKGVYYKPNIIDKITDSYGNVVQQNAPQIEKEIPIDQRTIDWVERGMHDVAHYYQGTVYPFLHDVPGNIRAKTGTAEVYENVNGQMVYRTHGWIVGSFDYNNKTYSFAFHMTYGGGGFYIGKSLRRFVNCLYSDFKPHCDQK